MNSVYPPTRSHGPQRRKVLLKLAERPARTDTPVSLPIDQINLESSLFQPRYDSIAFAPGRSERHITQLASSPRAGHELDPVKVVALGDRWFLVDGHHRLDAYRTAGWTKPVPVTVLQSDTTGDARIDWAIRESVRDNHKSKLPMSETDKMDAAWSGTVRRDSLSISKTAAAYGVSERSAANMRKTLKELEEAGASLDHIRSWIAAKGELKRLRGAEGTAGGYDFDARHKDELARKLKNAMDMVRSPRLLAEVLEAYEPGIVDLMAGALQAAREEEECDI